MFIGRDPGKEEDLQGRPFVGRSGQLLNEFLSTAGLSRRDVYISNLCKCSPPDNRNTTAVEKAACRQYLEAEIVTVNPKIIVTLGGDALEALTGQKKVMKVAGTSFHFKNEFWEGQIFAALHPSYILRNISYKLRAENHFKDLGRIIRGEEIERTPVKYITVTDFNKIDTLISKISQQKRVAFDLETTSLNFLEAEILCFSFSWKKNTAVVLPMLGYKKERIWPDDQYNAIMGKIRALYTNPNIEWIAHNISYDGKVLNKNNITIKGKIHDTMLLSTLIDENAPDLKGLKPLAETYTDMGNYDKGLDEFKINLKAEKSKRLADKKKEVRSKIKDLTKLLKKVDPTDDDYDIIRGDIRELDFEKETELIKFIKENKNKHRFTIYTNCEKGYSFEGITLSPYWKWRTGNKYNNCLIYADPSHLKLNINVNNITFYNKYNFDVPEMNKAKVIDNFETQ